MQSQNNQDDYRQVRHDLIFVLTMNAIFFAILIGLYFVNRATGQIDSFFVNLLKF